MATPERGERIKELFHAALERATGERPDFLSGACAATRRCGSRSSRS